MAHTVNTEMAYLAMFIGASAGFAGAWLLSVLYSLPHRATSEAEAAAILSAGTAILLVMGIAAIELDSQF